jgi:hypothetical protein
MWEIDPILCPEPTAALLPSNRNPATKLETTFTAFPFLI